MALPEDEQARSVARLQKSFAKQDQLAIDDAIKGLLEEVRGRKFLWWLLKVGKVNSQPFAIDSNVMAYQCGELNVGNTILARIVEVDPSGFMRLQQENYQNARDRTNTINDAARRASSGASTDDDNSTDTSSDSSD